MERPTVTVTVWAVWLLRPSVLIELLRDPQGGDPREGDKGTECPWRDPGAGGDRVSMEGPGGGGDRAPVEGPRGGGGMGCPWRDVGVEQGQGNHGRTRG